MIATFSSSLSFRFQFVQNVQFRDKPNWQIRLRCTCALAYLSLRNELPSSRELIYLLHRSESDVVPRRLRYVVLDVSLLLTHAGARRMHAKDAGASDGGRRLLCHNEIWIG